MVLTEKGVILLLEECELGQKTTESRTFCLYDRFVVVGKTLSVTHVTFCLLTVTSA